MANKPGSVKVRQADIDALIKTYRQAYKDIVETIVYSTDAGKIQKARVMATIKKNLAELGDNVDKWAKTTIPQYYLDGANQAVQGLKAQGVDLTKTAGLAAINKSSIEALVSTTSNALYEAITGIQRNVSSIIDDAVRQQTNFVIADGRLKGEALKTVTSSVKQNITDNGIGALTDTAGRQWSFDRYAEMLVRTKVVEARNTGLANRMLQNGYDLVEVTSTGSSDPICAAWEGQILSVTGNTPGYPTLSDAEADGLFHPNCQHAINAINPELAGLTSAYDNPYDYEAAGADEGDPPTSRGTGKAQNISVYHGSGGNAFSVEGADLFGNAFYVARDKATASEFGKVTAATLNIKPSEILTIKTDAQYNQLITSALKAYPSMDIQQSLPKYAQSLGYKAIEGTAAYDPLAGIAVFDKSLIK